MQISKCNIISGYVETSLYQKHIILIFVCNSKGNLSSSPSTIKLGVEDLTDRTLLQNCSENKRIKKVSIDDLLEWLNYIVFCRGHTEHFLTTLTKITIVIEQ